MYIQYIESDEEKKKRKVARVFAYILLGILTFLCLFPFLLLIINATHSNAELKSGFSLLPGTDFFKNFAGAWSDISIMMGRGLWNSFFVATCSALLTTYFSVMTAYALYAYDLKFKKAILTFILAIMMIPTQASSVGFVQIINNIGLTNSYLPLIIPGIASPLTFFYLYQYMKSNLPFEVIESSRVDGSNEFITFNKIAVPIMIPAMAVQGIFAFVASWNNYFVPALLLSEKNKKTLPVMMATLRSTANAQDYDQAKIYTFVLISILPVIIVYLILSKFIIKGVSAATPKQ